MPKEEQKNWLTKLVERKPPLYWWLLLNISMACIAVVSWLYFVPTFNYPEDPANYERIIKLGRTPELPAYSAIDAPDGETLSPQAAHRMFTFSELSDTDLSELNSTLLRNYIQNIKLKKFNFYVKGKFKIQTARALTQEDIFQDGIVIQARALRQVGTDDRLVPFLVSLEYILPGVTKNQLKHFSKGKIINLHKVPHHASVIHVRRATEVDGEIIVHLTAVPITTSPPQQFSGENANKLNLDITIPERIYPEFGLPVLK